MLVYYGTASLRAETQLSSSVVPFPTAPLSYTIEQATLGRAISCIAAQIMIGRSLGSTGVSLWVRRAFPCFVHFTFHLFVHGVIHEESVGSKQSQNRWSRALRIWTY